VKETGFGLAVFVYMVLLCRDTLIHAIVLGPVPPQLGEPDKQPF